MLSVSALRWSDENDQRFPTARQRARYLDDTTCRYPPGFRSPAPGSMNMKVFIDAEFTSLNAPDLLSIGLVADDGRECYVELAVARRRVNACVQERIAPYLGLMPVRAATRQDLGRFIGEWLLTLGQRSIDVVYDFHADFEWLEDALRAAGLWSRLSGMLLPHKVAYLARQRYSDEAMDTSWTASSSADGIARHHALADARALRAGYEAAYGTAAASKAGFTATAAASANV